MGRGTVRTCTETEYRGILEVVVWVVALGGLGWRFDCKHCKQWHDDAWASHVAEAPVSHVGGSRWLPDPGTGWAGRRASAMELARLCATNAARRYGLYLRTGCTDQTSGCTDFTSPSPPLPTSDCCFFISSGPLAACGAPASRSGLRIPFVMLVLAHLVARVLLTNPTPAMAIWPNARCTGCIGPAVRR